MYAMVHIAMHDALNAIDRRSRPYAYDARVDPDTSADAAVAAAARDVLVATIAEIPEPFPDVCRENAIAGVETDYSVVLAGIPDTGAKTLGIAVGQAAAAAIPARRVGDGSDTTLLDFSYEPGVGPGAYQFR